MLRTIRRFGITLLIASSLNIASSLSNPRQTVATVVKLPDGDSQYGNSDRYEGNFASGKKQGKGTYTLADGGSNEETPDNPELPPVSSAASCEIKRRPQFPESLVDQDIEARPVVELIIDESGKVIQSKLVESSPYPAIDRAFLEIASSLSCPARGERYRVRLAISFAQEGSEFERETPEHQAQPEPERSEQQQEGERQQPQKYESPPLIE
ncbi:MAG: TonB family protein [Symploca sp. SIO2G7]|nr:TonB family protein [Symploca sp. SIO2G7]